MKPLLYYYAIRDLKPVQIRHQIYRKILPWKKTKDLKKIKRIKDIPKMGNVSIYIPELDSDSGYLGRFNINDLLENKIELLHETHIVSLNDWKADNASHLWNYNLHYQEFTIPLAINYKRTKDEKYYLKWKEYTENWIDSVAPDSFEPYTISLRIPNLLTGIELMRDAIDADNAFKAKLNDSLYRQYRFLIKNRELNLLANHYLENLKTIVIGSTIWDEEKVFTKYFPIFLKEINEQTLPDGFHFELSPMYHRIILEDILRVYTVLKGAGKDGEAKRLKDTLVRMADAIASFERNTDRIPLFNDAGDNIAKDTKALVRAVERVTSEKVKDNITSFGNAGYYRINKGNNTLIADCGKIGPRYMSGHSHCDTLSFELFLNGKPLFVNSGTNQYQGIERQYYRSTEAHNTLMIDDRQQSELWGEHRAARKATAIKAKADSETIEGSFKSYLGDNFQRKFIWKDNNRIEITESATANDTQSHILRSFCHLSPEYRFETNDNRIIIINTLNNKMAAVISVENTDKYIIHQNDELCRYAPEFGRVYKNETLEIVTEFRGTIKRKIAIGINT